MKAACLCGRVSVTIPDRPTSVTFCDCNLCRKSGAVWSYFPRGALEISGETRRYLREDVNNPVVEVHSCSHCATTTHWISTRASGIDRMGVNMRLFQPAEVAGLEARFMDGLGWDGLSAPSERRPPGKIGVDVSIA